MDSPRGAPERDKANSTSSSTPLAAVASFWKEFDLEKERSTLDEQGLRIAENQENSQKNRRKLAESTRDFKKASTEDKLSLFNSLLKGYQEEVDNLTKRAKYGENAFLNIYQKLYEAPDPYPVIASIAEKDSKLSELESENRKMKVELEEFRMEATHLKNQQATIRRLEERCRQLEQQMEEKVKEIVEIKQRSLAEENQKTLEVLKEREQLLQDQLRQAQDSFSTMQKLHDLAQSQLFEVRAQSEEERGEKRRRDDDFSGPGRRSGGQMQSNSRNGGRFGSELSGGRGGGRGQMQSNSRNGGRFGDDRGGRNEGGRSGGRDRMESSPKGGRFGSDRGNGSGGRDRMETFSKGGRFGSDMGRESEGRRSGGRDRMEPFPRKGGRFGSEMASPSDNRRGKSKVGSGYGRDMAAQGGSGRFGKKEGAGMGRGSSMLLDEDDTDNEDGEEEEENGYKGFRDLIESEEESEESDEDDEVEDEKMVSLEKEDSPSAARPSSPGKSDSHLTETRFDQFPLSPLSLKGVKDAGYKTMTVVQEATLPIILKGKDVLAKAKTGTGKTVAFLLPSIEVVVKSPPNTRDQKRPPVLVLVICPTRELATQAATEANTLLKYHPSIGVQVVIGGTRLALEQKRMQANPCQILVATPGRLRDHVENTAGFATRLMGVKVLVLDEADHLLDMGFRKEIEKIISAIPKQRQTLLFSATVPPEVRQICHIALKRDHEFVNTVVEGSEETHAQVQQMHLVSPLESHFSLLYALLKEHIADDLNYKVLVFCTTAMVTKLVAELLGELNLNVREIHSRKPQSYRTRVSDEFRKSTGLILVSSDVSARGVDYPDVTLVVQIGVPADRQQYIHRLGRTGRKGKEGQGILLLAPWEEYFLSTIKDLPISKAPVPLLDPEAKKKVERALSHIEMKTKESAYQAWLGYYNSNRSIGKDKYRLVELANEFSQTMGLDNPPAIPKLVLGKMGLKNIPGLRSK